MATVKDWMSEAADRICREVGQRNVRTYLQVAAIIAEHSQMRPDMAYMPVPRCDGCRWWTPFAPDVQPATIGGIVDRLRGEFGDVLAKVDLQPLGDCRLFECHEKEQVEHTSKLIVSRTGSGEATISTTSDFGCVQFEAKP